MEYTNLNFTVIIPTHVISCINYVKYNTKGKNTTSYLRVFYAEKY